MDSNSTNQNMAGQSPAFVTPSYMFKEETEFYINSNRDKLLDAETCSKELFEQIQCKIMAENSLREKEDKIRRIRELPLISIEMLIAARYDVALVAGGDKSNMGKTASLSTDKRMKLPIAIYQFTGDNYGVWEVTNSPYESFGVLVEQYLPSASKKDKMEVFTAVKGRLRVVYKCCIPYYVAVNNGIFDVLTKQFYAFSPDVVFTSKIHTNLNMNAQNPVLHIPEDGSQWDCDGWLDSLGTPEFVEHIKEVIQAACLPLAPRDKMVLFYSRSGNNGKGTICQLIRNLLGEETVVSIPLTEFSKEYGLSKLPNAVAVITDENDVSSFNKGLGNLKSVITGDVVTINEKYVPTFDFRFQGLVLQCCNDLPNGTDKTGSFQRRLHIIPFQNCFTGCQKRYIKSQLIHREDVLEYILKKVLIDMPYREEFTETPMTQDALNQYIMETNSVVRFLSEILPEAQWDLLPATDFLYEGYKNWYKKVSPSGKVCGRNEFIESVKKFVNDDPDASAVWEWTDSTRTKGYIDCQVREPLIVEYNMYAFQNDSFSIGSVHREYACANKLKSKYSGLKRKVQGTNTVSTTD